MDTAGGTAPGTIPIGITTGGLVHSVSTMEADGTTAGAGIMTIGIALTMHGILTTVAWLTSEAVIGTTIVIPEPSLL